MKYIKLPDYTERKISINMIIIHCFALSVSQMINTLKSSKLSTHYIIGPRGGIIRCVPDSKQAWHAGKSFWNGAENLNQNSIGIEICSPSLGQNKYHPAQIKSLCCLCKKLIKKYNIPVSNIVGHSDIAPTRKTDPGFAFPWKKLSSAKIGLWYNLEDSLKINTGDINKLLSLIGYDTKDLPTTLASAYAFCRHFLPQFVTADHDISHLIENPLTQDFSFTKTEIFINTLKAVAYTYCKASNKPCKI